MEHTIEEIKKLYAAPRNYPVTSGNPGVWKILDVRFEVHFKGIDVLIRGEGSMWFNAKECWITHEKSDLDFMLESKREKELISSLCYSKIV